MLRRRLFLGTLALLTLVFLSAGFSLISHETLHGHLDEVSKAERDMAGALALSLAVRDVYAHQAHSVVLNDKSHFDLYRPALQDAKNLFLALEGFLTTPEDQQTLAKARELLEALDANFWQDIAPRLGGSREALVRPHDRALLLTDQIGAQVDALTRAVRARVDEAQHMAHASREQEVVTLALVLALAVLVAIFVSRWLIKAFGPPLSALEEGARHFASGDLAHRIPIRSRDELSALAIQMNAMASEIAERGQKLLESETLASLGRLAAGIAHEVNNPLAAISGYTQLLTRNLKSHGLLNAHPELNEDLNTIQNEVQRCREIVQGLLDLARPPRLVRFPVELSELTHEVARALETAGLPCRLQLTGPDLELDVDPTKVRQIIWNLLKNAAEAGAPVTVALSQDSGFAHLDVSDTGTGIPTEMREHLFEPFRSQKVGGTGLGLSVSRSLARAHGGDLVLLASSPNAEGFTPARLRLSLPLAPSTT